MQLHVARPLLCVYYYSCPAHCCAPMELMWSHVHNMITLFLYKTYDCTVIEYIPTAGICYEE